MVSRNGLSYTDKNVGYRPGRSMLVPYYDFSMTGIEGGKLPFKEINIGPTPHMNLSKMSVNGLLFKFFGDDSSRSIPDVECSKIPYRTW